eukprot:gene1846-24270_t
MASLLLGNEFAGPDGSITSVPSSELDECDVVGLYFSAHWCPPCRHFTPQLIEAFNAMRHIGKKFQIVFVSSDRSQSEFQEYYKSMPWLALPYKDARCSMLSSKFKVLGIPKLVFIKGREAMSRPELFPFDNFTPSLGSCIDIVGNCTVS